MKVEKGAFWISTDKAHLQLDMVHKYMAETSYWNQQIPFETLKRAAENSLTFGLYHNNQQVGYARVISDLATIAYLGDVFIHPDFQGQGLGKWLIANIHQHPDLQGLRRWILLTRDAHGLYAQNGWKAIEDPALWMEKAVKDPYIQKEFP